MLFRKKQTVAPVSRPKSGADHLRSIANRAETKPSLTRFPIRDPYIAPGVVPAGEVPQVASDSLSYECARQVCDGMERAGEFGASLYGYRDVEGFPGYPYLMALSLRVEYRNMATALANEMTRKWIKFNSTDTKNERTKKKITEIEQEFTRLDVQQTIRRAIESDALYGTGQILINVDGANNAYPLIADKKTVKPNSFISIKNVDPIWTTPLAYNALDPSRKDFYMPSAWWVMGQKWDATRILTIITREVPDIFKPAFNFSGISLSQLVEPYVNNWLRTRQSVSDLINNFSIVILKTAMNQILTDPQADPESLFNRIRMFSGLRSNKGVFALDKDSEEMDQIAVPLGGLHELQAQAQEQMCASSKQPSVIQIGVAPSGFGNVAEGEIRVWHEWVHSQQEAHTRNPIQILLELVQVSKYGEVDPEITFDFEPLYEMTEEQMSTIRLNDSTRAGNLIDRGVIDAQEERDRLARDPDSGYNGIDIDREIVPPDEAEESANLGRATA